MENFYAHRRENGELQTVLAHLLGTAEKAKGFAAVFDAQEAGYLCGILHDIGKYSAEFQNRLLKNGKKVDHSTAGAKVAWKSKNVPASFCIAGHHGGLPDGGNRTDAEGPSLLARMKKAVPNYDAWEEERQPFISSLPNFCNKDAFTDSFFIRMLYSCLVDADYLDTEAFMTSGSVVRGDYDTIPVLAEKLTDYIAPWWEPTNALNKKRCEILNACLKAGSNQQNKRGLYTLTVPTGGGKTVSSLAFALQHAKTMGLDRVIYVIPYCSIIEQTAAVFRQILGDKNVLEHHAGVDYEVLEGDIDSFTYRKSLAAENWDMPVVVTTAVQFFESLYANRASKCRKLHHIANSVILFDEAQMLPSYHLRPCIAAISQLVAHYRATAVLCTATQPALNEIFAEFLPEQSVKEICPNTEELYQFFRRVTIKQEGLITAPLLAEKLNRQRQALCIVNTRKQAQEIFSMLEGEGNYHLSTLMYAQHRRQILDQVRIRLKKNLPCRLIATSLVEAGVDIDFPVVYREEAGLDSIIQAAGRCNREGKRSAAESFTYLFHMDEPAPPLFAMNIAASRRILADEEEIDGPQAIANYFYFYRLLLGKEAQDRDRILDALQKGISGSIFPFAQVAEKFHYIEQNTKTIYIALEENETLIQRIRQGEYTQQTLRDLNQYGIQLYPNHYAKLQQAGYLEKIDEAIVILSDRNLYSGETGLSIAVETGQGYIF